MQRKYHGIMWILYSRGSYTTIYDTLLECTGVNKILICVVFTLDITQVWTWPYRCRYNWFTSQRRFTKLLPHINGQLSSIDFTHPAFQFTLLFGLGVSPLTKFSTKWKFWRKTEEKKTIVFQINLTFLIKH